MASEIANRRDRIRAGFVDGLVFLPLAVLDVHVGSAGWELVPNFVYFLLSWQVGWVYSVALHGWRGQTVGKAVYRIRVVRHSDRGRLGWVRALVRDLPYIILIWLASAVWVGWNLTYLFGFDSKEVDTWADRFFDRLYYANIAWMVLEFITMAIHPERRAIHDLLAGSVVIKEIEAAEPDAEPDSPMHSGSGESEVPGQPGAVEANRSPPHSFK